MSIANLETPNTLDLYCRTLTASGLVNQKKYYRIDRSLGQQTIATNTITPLLFPINILNSNFAAPAGSLYTVPISGLYSINYTVSLNSSGNGIGLGIAWIGPTSTLFQYARSSSRQFGASALTVGPPVSGITLDASDADYFNGTALIAFNAGEQFEINIFQNSGLNRTTQALPVEAIVSIVLVSEF